jgi:hypothetical protein
VFYRVGTSSAAKAKVATTGNASLTGGSILALNEGSTLTVEEGKTLTVKSGAVIDFRNLGKTVPADSEAAPIQIKGVIEVMGTGTLIGPNPGLYTTPSDIYKFCALGAKGKIVLNYGTSYTFGAVSSPALTAIPFIGSNTGSLYQWNSTSDGAQIILDTAGITIRDTDDRTAVVTSNIGAGNTYAHIAKTQTLTLDANVQLRMNSGKGIFFAGGGSDGGAGFKGPGVVFAGLTTITGGSDGWQAFGPETIGIRQDTGLAASIVNLGSGTATSLRALGPNAVIRQTTGRGNALYIQPNTRVELGGTAASPGGSLVLESGPNPGRLAFGGADTAKLLIGPGTGGKAVTGRLTGITIGGKLALNYGLTVADYVILDNKLVMLGGANRTASLGLTAGTAANNNVTIVSTAAFANR